MKAKVFYLTRAKALKIVCDHNCIPMSIAQQYTDSEISETLKHASGHGYILKLK